MALVKNIKKSTARFLLRKKLSLLKREIQSSSFSSLKEVGVLYDATDKKTYDLIRLFIHELKKEGKRVVSIGFVNSKKEAEFIKPQLDFFYFNKKNTNWLNIPSTSEVKRFINTNFDLLIDLNIDEHFPLEYICALSRSKFKVGKTGSYHSSFCDMQIDISQDYSVKFLLSQLKHYLNLIN
ncbi:MAG: hypothetical protein HUU48_11830 [Flavobacteriales bacterium]|nr:hypothetical protein [Flavobacteriales bacterium]